MRKELEQDLKQIVNLCYCHEGEEKYKQHIQLIRPVCKSKEMKEILKVIKREIKQIDDIFDDYYKWVDEVVKWC